MQYTSNGEGENMSKVSRLEGWVRCCKASSYMKARARGYLEGLETAAAEVAELRGELDDTRRRLRRAIGVVSDLDRTRSEAAAVLDDHAADATGIRGRPPAGQEGIVIELGEHAERLAELEQRADRIEQHDRSTIAELRAALDASSAALVTARETIADHEEAIDILQGTIADHEEAIEESNVPDDAMLAAVLDATAPPVRCSYFGEMPGSPDNAGLCVRDRGHPNEDGQGGHRADP